MRIDGYVYKIGSRLCLVSIQNERKIRRNEIQTKANQIKDTRLFNTQRTHTHTHALKYTVLYQYTIRAKCH